ncbi:MATE family efflux transporter [Mesoplasma seiffertii]|uniref:MATE family efflux transporter n=1 Tax=Mesoplasma seiffertii TaxID=28224 RepID=UPI0006854288|nr:MATE family efflux transporter [Mesoplasma seiffertii]
MTKELLADKKNKWFASRAWYAAALTVIVWSVFQEIIMASTDIVDSLFVSNLADSQVVGFSAFKEMIANSGWDKIDLDILESLGLGSYYGSGMSYTAGQIAVNGISASNQMYVIMFCMVSGFCYGCGVYSSQYYGSGNYEKLRQVTAMKMIVVFSITTIFALLAIPGATEQIVGFTTGPNYRLKEPLQSLDPQNADSIKAWFGYIQNEAAKLSTQEGVHYYQIVAPTYLLLTINQVAITTLRETRRPLYSFWMALIALGFNCLGNVILTDQTVLGDNALGVRGSAVATAIARALQTVFIVTLLTIKKFEFIPIWRSFIIQKRIVMNTTAKAMPILFNELLFAFGTVVMVKLRGKYSVEALTANAIYATITMGVFSPLYHGMNAGITVFVGNELGANNLKAAEYNAKHLYIIAVLTGIVAGAILAGLSGIIPNIWEINSEAKRIASQMLLFYGLLYFGVMIANSAYSIQRAGGRVWEATLTDSVFNWIFQVPTYAILILLNTHVNSQSGFISLDITWVFLIAQSWIFLQGAFGYLLYRRKKWLVNLTAETDEKDNSLLLKLITKIRGRKKLNPNMSYREEHTVERIEELIAHTKANLQEVLDSQELLENREEQILHLQQAIKDLEDKRVLASEGFRSHKIGRIRKDV